MLGVPDIPGAIPALTKAVRLQSETPETLRKLAVPDMPGPIPALPRAVQAQSETPEAPQMLGVPDAPSVIPAPTIAVQSPSQDSRQTSPGCTESPSEHPGVQMPEGDTKGPLPMPPTSTITELLKREGLSFSDIITVQVNGQVTRVIWKGTQYWKIHEDIIRGEHFFKLVILRPAVRDAVARRLHSSTITELLKKEGLSFSDIMTVQVDGEVTKAIWKGTRYWRIHEDFHDAKRRFRLVRLGPAVRDAIARLPKDREDSNRTPDTNVAVDVADDDIVDRPGDPGYKAWVKKMIKPSVQGSRPVATQPRVETAKQDEDGGADRAFWWMDDEWHERYESEPNLARVVAMQSGVSPRASLAAQADLLGCEPAPGAAHLDPGHQVGHRREQPIRAQGL